MPSNSPPYIRSKSNQSETAVEQRVPVMLACVQDGFQNQPVVVAYAESRYAAQDDWQSGTYEGKTHVGDVMYTRKDSVEVLVVVKVGDGEGL
ncbi:hypothetical protein PRZ48_011685 [Zasmidium cellare]|uniref:Uncharacterized protein n=1 Tax=Zasmidium cellare TaxID=395010 RepID=A0ABR0E789_ZASCE|nr:hypothetical protein PRZ48_011685 [Zasmidium cellare]